jgi:acyl-CoA thioesterase
MAYELDEDIAVVQREPRLFSGRLTDRWNIGTVPNGGYVLSMGLNALGRFLPFPDPIAATAYFVRPTEPGEMEIRVEEIKRGKRYATAEARLVQKGEERIRVLATFGAYGDPAAPPRYVDGAPPELPRREDCLHDRPAGLLANIAERLDMALDRRTVPFLRGDRGEAVIRGWLAFADGRSLDPLALALAADAFPPPAMNAIDPGWFPTLELTVHFRARPVGKDLRCVFRTRFLFAGHLEEDGELWDERGQLVAQSRQLAVTPLR